MKKKLVSVMMALAALAAMAVPSFAAGTDYSALTTGFTAGMADTVTMLMGLLPIGLTLFSVVFAAKKAISFFKTMT